MLMVVTKGVNQRCLDMSDDSAELKRKSNEKTHTFK